MKLRRMVICLLVFGYSVPWLAHAQGLAWTMDSHGRSAQLNVPTSGKIGFTSLSSTQTGLRFTNLLTDASSAANRVLENGSGVAIGDFDKDGRADIFFCSLTGHNALFRNLDGWRFDNVTIAAGLNTTNHACRGAVFADLNGDTWPDLLISTLAQGVLCFLNNAHGRFIDVTRHSGLGSTTGSMTLALADVDGNGTLDLYVTNYRPDDIRDRSRIDVQRVNGQVVLAPGLRDRLMLTKEGVVEFGEPDALYLNDGHAHFRQLSWTSGQFVDEESKPLTVAPRDWGLTASFRDLNGDGFPDLYVCNDYWTPDRIWINDGNGRFQAVARTAIRHTSENSMGVDFADVDRDGHTDFLVLDMLSRDPSLRKRQALAQTKRPVIAGENTHRPQIMRNTLFHNRGDGTFAEVAEFAGLPASEWSWQPVFLDVDLDGYEDLLITAGHRRDIQDLDVTARIRSLQHPWPKGMDPKAHQEAFTREMMEHGRLYPTLEMPMIAFRNLTNLKFADVTAAWGTSTLGVHQGIALGDLDGDGDLDFVVNNLNGVCGVYRNDGTSPRVAVRLSGLRPNTEGIGARVTLRNGAVPLQTQEVVCGGRYLSGFEPLLVFGAGRSQESMTLEVRWRNGTQTLMGSVKPNRLYVMNESAASPAKGASSDQERPISAAAPPLFTDVSHLLNHTHAENDFDDFARQPLLPRKLSQVGPGLAWFDLDENGTDDLIIGSGRGGRLAMLLNDGRGTFLSGTNSLRAQPCTRDQAGLAALRTRTGQTVILAGSSNYEDALSVGPCVLQYDRAGQSLGERFSTFPGHSSTTGPLALGDLDGDGDLDLFVGGRVVPGRYPEPASSRIFLQDTNGWGLDSENSKTLLNVGLVTGAVWSDLDADGWLDLVIACEWGSIRAFKNQAGRLREVTAEWGLAEHIGWWSGVTTGDVDGDGQLDIVATNWGLNSSSKATPREPLRLFYGDLMLRGRIDLIETEFDPTRGVTVPVHRLDFMAEALPFLRERFASFKQFSEATIDQVIGNLKPPSELRTTRLASMIFLNRGGAFTASELPREAQFAPGFSVNIADFNGDGHEDLFIGQNFFALPWQIPRQDGGRGLMLMGNGTGSFEPMAAKTSGLEIYGEQRGAAIADFNEDGRPDLAVSQNGASTKLFLNQGGMPGLRIRLQGPAGNRDGIGAVLRLRFGDRLGPAREIHAGSGYWSQDSPVQVMGAPEPPTAILVRWPGGAESTQPVPPSTRELIIKAPAAP